jgi:hypothetical protein
MAVLAPNTLINVITDFLASNPSSEDIVAFHLPESLNERASELLALNRDGSLTPDERAEFDEYMRMDQFMTILKLKAQLNIAEEL